MAVTALEGRGEILSDLALAIEQIALSVACLGEAYELLPVGTADRLDAELFRPVQKAFGRSKRTHAGFAARVGLPAGELDPPSPGRTEQGAKGYVEQAVAASLEADRRLAELQDSMMPIEFGDEELRAGLSEVREHLAGLPNAAKLFLRGLGR